MNSKIIAVDFDGTLCENKWPEIGEANEDMIYYLRKRQAEGDKLILWTCRVGDMLRKAINWCYNYGLIFNAVNENLPEIIDSFGSDTRKIFANEYIDDRNRLISSCREKSNMELWVENEVRIACEHERKASGTKEENNEFVEITEVEYNMRKHCCGCFGASNNDCQRCDVVEDDKENESK